MLLIFFALGRFELFYHFSYWCITGKKKLRLAGLPQSRNKNLSNMCIVGNPVRMISK
jgi:hypothetical protein